MPVPTTIHSITAAALLAPCATAFAHEDRLLGPLHWHASDALGLLALGVLVAVGLWLSRGGKGK